MPANILIEIIDCTACSVKALFLLIAANGAPIVADYCLHGRFSRPVDAGRKLSDGNRLLGKTKTWRGIASSVAITGLGAYLLRLDSSTGVGFALLTMAGDLSASFCKRRLGLPESSRFRGLDTLPESLLPLSVFKDSLGLNWLSVFLLVVAFWVIEEFVSPVLYRLHIRKRPY